MELEISKCFSYSFHLISAKRDEELVTMGGILQQIILFLDFEILTWKSMGKS